MKGKNQLLVGMKGSFENMTAVIAKDGDTIIKGKIKQMSNPRTAAQVLARDRFTLVSSIAAQFGKIQENN